MTEATVTELQEAITTAFNTFAADVLAALTKSVSAADTAVKGQDPGKTETVIVSIGPGGEGFVQIPEPMSRVTITTSPSSGTATLEAVEVEGPPATKLLIVGATPETTETVIVSIAAE